MSDLFSHSSVAADAPPPRPEVRLSVDVPAPASHAWAGLTEHLHLWWPADQLSRWGEDSFFDLEDKALVETSAEDDENVWAEVLGIQSGEWLELRWRHLNTSSTTHVRFEMSAGTSGLSEETDPTHLRGAEGAGEGAHSVLTLVHRGWTADDPDDVHTLYVDFWPLALARYRRFMGGT